MIITAEFIEKCQELEACQPAIEYLLEHEGQEYPEDYQPDWQLWAAGKGLVTLTLERLDWCAEREPWAALIYAAPLLTPERIDWCAERAPWEALLRSANLLTPERLDWCAERESRAVGRYPACRTPAYPGASGLVQETIGDRGMNTNNRRRTGNVPDNNSAIALVMGMMLFFWTAVVGAVLMYSGYAMTGQIMVVLGTTVTCGCFIRLILK